MSDGNGLDAAAYRQLSRLAPNQRSAVLIGLAESGVAAYVEDGWLHVDETRTDQARRICDRVLDRIAFEEIVANFAEDAVEPTAPAAPASAPAPTPDAAASDAAASANAAHADWLHTEATDPPPPRYVPPEPPRQPLAWVTRLAWFAVFAGPGALALLALLGTEPDPGLVWAAVLAFGGGIIALLMQHSSKPPEDDGPPDDGAVV